MRDALLDALQEAEHLRKYVGDNPLKYARWVIPQVAFLNRKSRRRLLRAGNRFGKSYVAIGDVAYRALGDHPFRGTPWRRTDQWIVCVTWRQALPLMKHLRSFVPDARIARQPNWYPDKGWGKDSPMIVLDNGSTIGFRTMDQGQRAHAGDELDHILIDEPPSAEHYRELERRVVSRAGDITMSMTPINALDDLQWLKDLCADGIVHDHHVRMTEEAYTYADDGSIRADPNGVPFDEAWIAQQRAEVLPAFAPIILDGEWDGLVVDALLQAWEPDEHICRDLSAIPEKVSLCLGLDHGSLEFTEVAILVAVDTSQTYPRVWVIDEYEAPANSPADQDARAILSMLRRHGLTWRDLDSVTGDIPHYGGRRNRVGRKSNAELGAELAREMNLPRGAALVPPILTAKSGRGVGPRGSVYRGLSWLHRQMLRPGHFNVLPNCTGLVKSIENYRGKHNDPYAHLIDALRYSLDPWIRRGNVRTTAAPDLYVV